MFHRFTVLIGLARRCPSFFRDHFKDEIAIYCGADGTKPGDGHCWGKHEQAWYGELEMFQGQTGYFVARAMSHICAPGFSFLMGMGMAMFSQSRTNRGWTPWPILRHFLIRGVLLILLGFVVRASSFIDILDGHEAHGPRSTFIRELVGFFQVMTALGLQMILTAGLMYLAIAMCNERLSLSESVSVSTLSLLYSVVAVICVVFCNIYIVSRQSSPVGITPAAPDAMSFSTGLERFMVLPGTFDGDDSLNFYPVLPWWPLCLTGATVAPWFRNDPEKAHQNSLYAGCGLLVVFILLRLVGGPVGNYRGSPRGVGEGEDINALMSFFNVCKYPPSLAYDCITMGCNLILLHLLSCWKEAETATFARPWLAFGRTLTLTLSLSESALIITLTGSHLAGLPSFST